MLIRSSKLAKARPPSPTVWWCDGNETLKRLAWHHLVSIADCEIKCHDLQGCYAFDIRELYCELFTKECLPGGPPALLYVRPSPSTAEGVCRHRNVELEDSNDCSSRDEENCDPLSTRGDCYFTKPELISEGKVCVNVNKLREINQYMEYQNELHTLEICHNLC